MLERGVKPLRQSSKVSLMPSAVVDMVFCGSIEQRNLNTPKQHDNDLLS